MVVEASSSTVDLSSLGFSLENIQDYSWFELMLLASLVLEDEVLIEILF